MGKGTPVSRSTTASPSDKRRKKSIDPGPELAHAATTKSVVDTSTTKRGCGYRVLKHHRTARRSSYVSYLYNYILYIFIFMSCSPKVMLTESNPILSSCHCLLLEMPWTHLDQGVKLAVDMITEAILYDVPCCERSTVSHQR